MTVTEQSASEKVLEYMRRTNRPYSAVDVHINLKGEIPKSQIIKILSSLPEIVSKQYNKQTVYCIQQQSETEENGAESEEETSENGEERKQNLATLQSENGELQAELNDWNKQLDNQQVEDLISTLSAQIEEKEHRLEELRKDRTESLDASQIHAQYSEYRKCWKVRRKLFMDIINAMTESGDLDPKQLMATLGLENDAEAGEDESLGYEHYIE